MPLFLILLPLAADGWHFRRHRKAYRYRNLLLTLVAAGDLLPLAGIVLFWLVKDNTGGLVTAAMWIFFAYLLLTLPRMAYTPCARSARAVRRASSHRSPRSAWRVY